MNKINKKFNNSLKTIIFAFIYSFILKIFLCIYSPIYSEVFTETDAAIFYGIGKALKNGAILYKDIFDHKTPYIYFINAFASIFDYKRIGMFTIEVLTFAFIIFYIYKIMNIFIQNFADSKKWSINQINKYSFLTLILCFLFSTIWTIPQITFGYNRTEEYANLFMLISYYIISKYFLIECKYKYERFKDVDIFIIGIMAGLTFMTNIRAVILFVPFALSIALWTIKNERKVLHLSMLFVYGLFGVVISMLPYFIYMLFTNSTNDMINAVITANIAYLNSNIDSLDKLTTHISFIKENIIFYLFCLMSIAIIIIKRKTNLFLLIPTLVSFIIAIYYVLFANRIHIYYIVILMPFLLVIPIFINELLMILLINKNKSYKYIFSAVFILCTTFHIFYYQKSLNNRYLNCLNRSTKIKNELLNIYDNLDDLYILSFGMNPEVYEYLGIDIKYKYFFIPKISYKNFYEPYNYQYRCLTDEKADVIIYREDEITMDFPDDKKRQIKYMLNHKYKFIKKIETNGIEGAYLIYVK